jgi:hypothetical protein
MYKEQFSLLLGNVTGFHSSADARKSVLIDKAVHKGWIKPDRE